MPTVTWCQQLPDANSYLMSTVTWCQQLPETKSYLMPTVSWWKQLPDANSYLMPTVTWCQQLPDANSYLMPTVTWCQKCPKKWKINALRHPMGQFSNLKPSLVYWPNDIALYLVAQLHCNNTYPTIFLCEWAGIYTDDFMSNFSTGCLQKIWQFT